MDSSLVSVDSFKENKTGTQIYIYWDQNANQLVLVGNGREQRLDPIGTLDESLAALKSLNVGYV